MNTAILLAVLFLSVLGLAIAIGLAYASKKFAVQIDPRVEAVEKTLAGLNCGVCGYAGCRGYAESVVAGEVDIKLCAPGGSHTAREIARVMGLELEEMVPKVAVVQCQGGNAETKDKFIYRGVMDCRAAQMLGAGFKSCSYGCLGLGSCAAACPFDAITMNENGLPEVDEKKCTACGVCVSTCPRGIMALMPVNQKVYLGCVSKERGRAVKENCQVGCIACRLCVRKNPAGEDGISMGENLPIICYERICEWSEANEVCPQNCFVIRKLKD